MNAIWFPSANRSRSNLADSETRLLLERGLDLPAVGASSEKFDFMAPVDGARQEEWGFLTPFIPLPVGLVVLGARSGPRGVFGPTIWFS